MIKADDTLTNLMYTLGENLIMDDRGDLGYGSYKGRSSHIYHGRRSPNHPSPLHHYQAGTILCLLAQFLRLTNVAAEAQAAAAEFEGFDLDEDFEQLD